MLGLFIVACSTPEPDPPPSGDDDPEPTEEVAAPTVDAPVDADLPDEITVAYFLEWPTPNQVAQIEETYDAELGVKVNWVSFDTGVAMSAAMASGDVDIAYSQGLVPFANAVTSGLEIQAVGVAVSYAENDNCVARTDLGITRDNAANLEGQQVAVPIGTVAHYKMLKEMQYLGVNTDNLELVDLAPADGAAALQRGDVAMACGWGGGLARMKEAGNILMTGAEMEEEIGLIVFDVISVTNDFAENYPGLVTRFLQVTENANAAYQADQSKVDVIAQAAGMDVEATESSLATFSFPNAEAQLSDAWFGGTVQNFVTEVANFFVEQGELDVALDDYGPTINTTFLEDVTPGDTWMGAMSMDDGGEMMESMERPDEITVAYFLEWPTPNQVAQLEETYDAEMGLKVNWVSFDTGVAMSAAMVSGDVDIAYSQGLVPFANAVTSGLEIKTVGIAVSYAENDNCVARTDLNITRDNVTDLHGEQVAVPIGTVAHYKMLKEMQYLGVDTDQLELVDLAPADGAAALQRGDVAMACGWGGGLARMKEAGNIIMTGAEMEEEIGLIVFDVISVTDDFAKNHGDVIVDFLQITEDANAAYNADQSKLDVIAQAAGMDEDATAASLATFSFPNAEAQLSDAWLGGTVQTFVTEVANFFVEQGELDAALDSYEQTIDTSFLEQVTPGDTWMGTTSTMTEGDEMMMSEMPEDMAERPDELTVAYFLEWPTPNQVAQLEETYDSELGMTVNWVSFDTGVAMSAAMASGDVDIAYSQGLVPFANAVTSGLEIQAVGVAVSYAENDNCVVRTDLGITRDNATDLHGEQVSVPLGTVAHYKMLKEMAHLGVDVDQLDVVDLAPADGAAALQRGDVAMACGWGGGLARMLEAGNVLMTGAEMEEEIGLIVFDVISVSNEFAEMHPSVVRDFLQVTEDANRAYAEDPSAEKLETIAQAAGMDLDAAESNLATFSFPTRDEQLSDAWFGGTVQNFVTEVANFFVEQGELDAALDDYAPTINTVFLENVE